MLKDTQVNFRTNAALLEKAKEVAALENLDMSRLFNALIQQIAEEDAIPVELLDKKESRYNRIVNDLYAEIDKGYKDYLAGRLLTQDEVFSKYE